MFLCLVMGILYLNLDRLGQPEELLPFIKPYYLILWTSLPLIMMFNAFKQFADGITDTHSHVDSIGRQCAQYCRKLSAYLRYIRIPELGLVGGGLSTLFARLMMLCSLCLSFSFTIKGTRPSKRDFASLVSIAPTSCN